VIDGQAPPGAAEAPNPDGFRLSRLPEDSRQRAVASQIKQYIAENGLRPGDRLPGEEWFAAALGVGRPLVREALKGLEAVGAVETRRGVGRFVGSFDAAAYVSHFTAEVLIHSFSERELAEARCLLEIASIAEALERLTAEDRDEIGRCLNDMRERIGRGESYIDADFGMHRIIVRRADNRLITAILEAIYELGLARGRGVSVGDAALAAQDLAEHEAIARAVIARNARAAQASLMAHFDTTARRLGFAPHWREVFGPAARRTD
jgi:GntR family transcriptional regulator, transcriptional repressor for pyruvate dehydrogenase complex